MEVPVIDLRQDEEAASVQLRKACETTGFFYLGGHGVSQELISEVFKLNKQLFALPLEIKQAMIADENNRGWTPFKEQTLDPANQTTGDTKEGFYFGRDIPADDPEASKPLHGPNQWPREELVPGYRTVTEQYMAECIHLGLRLTRLLALSLGLSPDHFTPSFTHPMINLRPLHYHAVVSDPGEGILGAGAHTDWGMITLLLTDDVPGLQIHTEGTWKDVPPKPGCFIINLGDMLERWTNGLYKSNLHRVVNTTGQERYSIPCFLEPNFEAVIECLPQCCVDKPASYPPTTSGQHMLDKYASTHSGYAAQGSIKEA